MPSKTISSPLGELGGGLMDVCTSSPDHCPSQSAPGHVFSGLCCQHTGACTLQPIGVKGTEGVAGNKAGKEAGLWCCQNIPTLLGQQYKDLFHWPWWSCVEFPLRIPRQSQALAWSSVPAAVSLPPPTPKWYSLISQSPGPTSPEVWA